jgi:hypothetical protein
MPLKVTGITALAVILVTSLGFSRQATPLKAIAE